MDVEVCRAARTPLSTANRLAKRRWPTRRRIEHREPRSAQRRVLLGLLALVVLAACGGPQGPGNLPPVSVEYATATSATTVLVRFNQAVSEGADVAANYRVVDGSGSVLKVVAAYPLTDDEVALATEPQGAGAYLLTVTGVARAADGWRPAAATSPASFVGSSSPAPVVDRVVPVSPTSLLVTFVEAASGAPVAMSDHALSASAYRAVTGGFQVLSAEFDDNGSDRTTVVLTTSPMSAGRQRLEVAGATTLLSGSLVDPLHVGGEFYGLAQDDKTAPYLTAAYAADRFTVVLLFSEPVSAGVPAAAVAPSDLSLTGPHGEPVSLSAVASEQHGTRLRVTVGDLAPGQVYKLTLTGLRDAAGNLLGGTASTTVEVVGPAAAGEPDDVAPRVTGAVSTGPTSVLVTFSEPVRGGVDSAENPLHYAIVGETDGQAAGGELAPQAVVKVTGATLQPNGRAVLLTTLAQSDITYLLTVVNVADLSGNLVVPPDRSQPYQVRFVGTPPSGTADDTDGDGLSDAAEQRGWTVVVRRADGTTTTITVTSDPYLADTDGDGLGDLDERTYLTNPRSTDTDGDQLTDYWELNYVYSDPNDQDSDSDGLNDGLEWWFFRTSPNLDDTDGDQILDGDEINLGNRNPRLADLPLPGIEIGAVDLRLDVRFSAVSQRGTRELEAASYTSTLSQSERRATSNTDSNTQQFMARAAAELKWSAKIDFGAEGKFTAEASYTGQWTSTFTTESARETQSAYERSTQTDRELQIDETMSREVVGASMRLTVTLRNLGNIAFNLSDVQVSVFMLDPAIPGRLIPIATLTPESEPAGGYNLGPLVPERGPLVFVNDQVFPSLVEELMRSPAGLVFKISNFDITDEFGRNFAFTSQDVNDRTATVVIDYGAADSDGDGEGDITERLKVSTSAGRAISDVNGDGVVDEDDRILFDARGRQVGITLGEALEAVLGLTHYDEDQNPTATLSPSQVENSYSTRLIGGVERLWRIRSASKDLGNPLKNWVVLTPEGIVDATAMDVRQRVLAAGEGITLAFVQDLDDDGLPASFEYMHACSDSDLDVAPNGNPDGVMDGIDTDLDGITDVDEVTVGWRVSVKGGRDYMAYSSCARVDTDGDKLSDAEELALGTDPRKLDTDGDGLTDYEEVMGFDIDMRFEADLTGVTTDPLDPDTDGDTLPDGAERDLGVDPNKHDGDLVFDNDGDTLVNALEDAGWTVTVYPVSTTPYVQPAPVVTAVTSSKDLADTDGDGVRDDVERQRGTDPRAADTDGDGLTDLEEHVLGTDPLDADTDDDMISDGDEVNIARRIEVIGTAPYSVHTDPLVADEDLDLVVDGLEVLYSTDPKKYDTDGDGTSDKVEIDRNLDADANNNTNPVVRDQLLHITYDIQGVRTTSNNICGEVALGSAWVTGYYYYTLGGVTYGGYYTTGEDGLGTTYVNALDETRILVAAPGASIQAFTTDLTRWDGIVPYSLENVNHTFVSGNGLFDSITTQVFRQRQTFGNPEDCVVNVRFTITPIFN